MFSKMLYLKQECISVGCVTPAAVVISGGASSPLSRLPPPLPGRLPLTRHTPCGQNEWHMPVKTVPSPIRHIRSVKIFELTVSCVRDQDATTVPAGHG